MMNYIPVQRMTQKALIVEASQLNDILSEGEGTQEDAERLNAVKFALNIIENVRSGLDPS
jgi:hypothetical protein